MMKISVIIPTYKPKEYLWECLASLVNQTFPKEAFEVILVLNGCEEPYKSDIEKYISTKMLGMNVNFIHTLQGGVSNARNLALDQVKGEYVTFIDDDDLVSPSYLEELYEKVDSTTIALSYPYAFDDGALDVQVPYHITDVFDVCSNLTNNKISSKVRKYFSGPCMKLIPMSFIQDRRFDVRFKNGEDSLFMFLISDKFKDVSFTSKNAIYYRRKREDSAVTTKRSRRSIINNRLKLMCVYSHIYWCNPVKYSFAFYLTRILAAIRVIIK